MMDRAEMILRHGFYAGMAAQHLKDESYIRRWLGRAQELTEADYLRESSEIQAALLEAGIIRADEDPFQFVMVSR